MTQPTHDPATPTQNQEPIAPERNVPPSPGGTVDFTPEQQAKIDAIIASRLERAEKAAAAKAEAEKTAATKTLEERLAEVEKAAAQQVKAAQASAVSAVALAAAANTHNPALVVKSVDLDGLDPVNDKAEIETRIATFVNENPYLAKSNPAGPAQPTPGITSTAGGGGKLLTPAEMQALTADDLQDPDTMKLYLDSMAVHGAQPV